MRPAIRSNSLKMDAARLGPGEIAA
jgi:hypothetical protein